MEEILDLLEKASYEYYNNDNSIMPDLEFDKCRDFVVNNIDKLSGKIKKRAKDFISKIGETPNSKWEKVKHEVPMVSLEKANSEEEFLAWENEIKDDLYIIMDKVDGISISLKYKGGKLKSAATRGRNGIGEEILKNVVKMKNVKKEIDYKEDLEIRGEIVLFTDDFNKINDIKVADGEDPLKTQRNGASGTAKTLDGKCSELLTILHYNTTKHFDTELEKMSFIQDKLGLKTCFWKVCSKDVVVKIFNKVDKEIREKMQYQIDGMVIRHNNSSLNPGEWSNGNPKGSIAWKFGNLSKESILLDVSWQVGMSGTITPVAKIRPIEVGGVTISNATLHNVDIFKKLKLYKGCRVLVSRRNDVTPYIEKNLGD
jgi:DNA ligase (NAD+)